jgi:F-type H+-transporting ATPase subunit b
MRTRYRLAIVSIVTALLCPALVFAADSPQEEGTWSALIFYAINFLLFIWIVKRVGGPQIKEFFRTRAKGIRENMSRAEKAFKDAQGLFERAADRLKSLEAEKARIAAELAEETSYQVKQINELGHESMARLARDASLSVAAAREAGQRRLREALAAAAGRIARELVQRDFQPADQARLVERFVGKLGEESRP